MDLFDKIRTTISQIQGPLLLAVDWLNIWDTGANGIVPDGKSTVLGGHCTKIAGWKTINGVPYICVQNSWGVDAPGSDNGLYYFSRELVNKHFGKYGIAYWSDTKDTNIKQLGWFQAILQNLVALYTTLITKNTGTMPPFVWTDPVSARHSVRVICDQERLSVSDKNILCACVEVESGFNPQAVHPNKGKDGTVWSTDWGIVQVNDYYNIGPGKPFPSVDYVLQNPEASVRFMCQMWKAGKQSLWASYTSKLYQKYL